MKRKIIPLSILAIFSLSIGGVIFASSYNNNVDEAEAYSVRNVPTTIDLNATSDDKIIEYYSDLTELTDNQKSGTNLLKNLKPILKNGQKYFSYGSSATTAVWQAYEIVDRDWVKSPANEIAGYNSTTNVISGYTYGKSNSNVGSNPYIHALYVNRTAENNTRAWGDHSQTNYGINQEHVWAKSCGFDNDDSATAAGARGDLMHLWAGNGKVNGSYHSNYYYGYVDTTKKYYNAGNDYSYLNGNLRGYSQTLGGNVTVFEPQDSDKGDIARAIFYMAARYNYLSGSDSDGINASNPNLEIVDNVSSWSNSGYTCTTSTTGKMGILSDLLAWNRLDPPDEWEIHRNDILYTNFTNNRNPFIDYPEWADYIWGDKVGTPIDPNTNTIHAFSGGSGEQEDTHVESVEIIETATIKVGESLTISPSILPHNATNKATTWQTSDNTIASVTNGKVTGVAVGTATITVRTTDGGLTDTCTVKVEAADTVSTTSDVLDAAFTGVPTASTYSDWADKTGTTGAVYAGNSSKSSVPEIQMRSNNNNSSIITTSSPGKIKKITVDWGASCTSGRTLDVYGSNSAYTASTDLYDVQKQGTKIGSIKCGTSTELTVNDDYKYVGVRSNSGALYMDSITFDWALAVSSVSLDINEIELDLYGGDAATLTATVLPENAANKNISWSTSDESVVTVENGEITAIGVGDATITVTTEDGSKTATCAITVVDTTPAETESVVVESSISAIASLNDWTNSNPYARGEANAVPLDENIYFYTTGTGDNGKYYTKGNNWRLYYSGSGNIVIKAINDCTINNVTLSFTISNFGVLSDSESNQIESGVPNGVNADSVTYTVTTGSIRIDDILVEYELPAGGQSKVLDSISISNYKTTFKVNSAFNFGGIVTAHFDNESSQNVTGAASFTGYDMSELGAQTVTVSYTYKDVTRTATYQITVLENDISPYANGVKYKLYMPNGSNYYFTGSMVNTYYGGTSTTYANGAYVYFEQNGNDQNLYFYIDEVKNYISVELNGNHINFVYNTSVPSTAWKYDSSDGCIYCVIETKRYTIGDSGSHNTFGAYDLDAHNNYLKPAFAETAESFSYSLLNMIACDPTGNTSPIYQSGYSWSDLNDIYDVMDSSEQTILKTADANQYSEDIVEQAMAKYEFIAGKYSLNNFIAERTPKVFPSRIIYTDIKENRILLIVLIASILTGVSVGLFYIVKKNKKEL